MKNSKAKGRIKRSIRIRFKINGTTDRPRLTVFRSNRYIYAQVIDDTLGKTLSFINEKEIQSSKEKKMTKNEKANLAGQLLAKKAILSKISKVVFDRNGYKYHGRVKALAEGAKMGGLKF